MAHAHGRNLKRRTSEGIEKFPWCLAHQDNRNKRHPDTGELADREGFVEVEITHEEAPTTSMMFTMLPLTASETFLLSKPNKKYPKLPTTHIRRIDILLPVLPQLALKASARMKRVAEPTTRKYWKIRILMTNVR